MGFDIQAKGLRTPCDWVASRYDFHKKVLQCKGIIIIMLLCTRQLIGPSTTLCACFGVVLIDNHQVTLLFGRVVVVGRQATNEPIYGWIDGWMVGR